MKLAKRLCIAITIALFTQSCATHDTSTSACCELEKFRQRDPKEFTRYQFGGLTSYEEIRRWSDDLKFAEVDQRFSAVEYGDKHGWPNLREILLKQAEMCKTAHQSSDVYVRELEKKYPKALLVRYAYEDGGKFSHAGIVLIQNGIPVVHDIEVRSVRER